MRLGVFKRVVKLLKRQIADAQDVKKVLFPDIDQTKVARQYLDIAQPKAVSAIPGWKYKIVRQCGNLPQHLVAFVAEQIRLVEARQRRRQEISTARQQGLGRNIRRRQDEALEIEGVTDIGRRQCRLSVD